MANAYKYCTIVYNVLNTFFYLLYVYTHKGVVRNNNND